MITFRKIASTGLLAAILAATGLGATSAGAFEQDRLTQFSIALGRMDDGYEYRRPFYNSIHFAGEPVCHLGHTQLVWREVCKPVGYAVNYCWDTRVPYRPVVCN